MPRYLINTKDAEIQVETTDVIIIGAGLAGLYTALRLNKNLSVTIIAKESISDSNTEQAQGGIAAAICKDDSTELHKKDTLSAGHGLCDEKIVEQVVEKGPEAIEALLEFGVPFDTKEGELALTQEGAHSCRRVLHASGDGTGRVIRESLTARVLELENVRVLEDTFAIDIYTQDNISRGVLTKVGHRYKLILAKYVVLASGGAGQLYKNTTNPEVATGDGIAMAYRAGVNIRDLEFIQFHPTALAIDGAPRFLISEAVRGEGAILLNNSKERFMEKYHELLELAPRDIVSRAMAEEMEREVSEYLFLDLSHLTEEKVSKRFPTIYKTCHQYGIKIPTQPIPVAPAAHYIMGGITVDIEGKTNVQRLLACGEVTSSGLHGANRLASNSLLEALVFGGNIADVINKNINEVEISSKFSISETFNFNGETKPREIKKKISKLLWTYAGLKRSKEGLQILISKLEELMEKINVPTEIEDFEAINMLQIGILLAKGALIREESRGGHYRSDFPQTFKKWKKNINFNICKEPWYTDI
ncbi:L-aspartate oxidase [Alkalicella caledoniensis]|nr:L-aspartate oxidase [Alkalicella caledoniensis]